MVKTFLLLFPQLVVEAPSEIPKTGDCFLRQRLLS